MGLYLVISQRESTMKSFCYQNRWGVQMEYLMWQRLWASTHSG